VRLTVTERLHLLQSTREFFESQKQQARAAGKCLTYTLDDLHGLLEKHLAEPNCSFCAQTLSAGQVTLGHRVPIGRGGRFTFKNIEVSCRSCAVARGVLDDQEFRELLLVAAGWPKPVRNDFFQRLRAGTALVATTLPAHGSLEWFTGAPCGGAGEHSAVEPIRASMPSARETPCSA
jgi:hypothetical protein